MEAVFKSHYVGIVLQDHDGTEYLLIFKKPSGVKPEDFETKFQDVTVQGQDLNTLKIFPGHARASTPIIPNKSPDAIAFSQYQVTGCIDIPLPPLRQRSRRGSHRLRRTVGVRLGPPIRSHKDDTASYYVSIEVREGGNSVYAKDFRVGRSRFSLAFIDCDEVDVPRVHTPGEPGGRSKAPRGSVDVSHVLKKPIRASH